jgi:hypothetical protein
VDGDEGVFRQKEGDHCLLGELLWRGQPHYAYNVILIYSDM